MTNKIVLKKLIYAIAIVLFLIQPFLTWFNADDYCLIPKLKAYGMWQCMYDDYLNWDGRSLSVAYAVSRLGLLFEIYWIGPFIGSVLIAFSAYFIVKAQTNTRVIYTSIDVLILIWLGSFYFISQTLYWSTGIGYTFEMFILILSAFFLRKDDNNTYLLKIPLFFILGSFSPNAVMALLVVILIDSLSFSFKKDRNKLILNIIYIFSILASVIVVLMSPGNKNRLPQDGAIRENLTNPYQLLANIKWLIESLFQFNTPITWILILVGIMGATINFNDFKKAQTTKYNLTVSFLSTYKWLIAATISVFAFLPFPGFFTYSPRINIHFFTFILLFSSIHFNSFYNHINKVFIAKIASLTLVFFIIIITFQSYDAYITKGMMAERIKFFKTHKGEVIQLETNQLINPPTTRKFQDVETDSLYWLNICTADYFGLKSIKRK